MQKGLMAFRGGNEYPKVGINNTKPFCKNLKEKKMFTKASFNYDYMLGTLLKLNSCYVNSFHEYSDETAERGREPNRSKLGFLFFPS